MERKVIAYTVKDRIATITLNRPQRRNSWTGRMHVEYRWSIEQAENDPEVRAILVTGAGRDFCVGADSRALEGHVEKGGYDPGTPDTMPAPGYGVRPEFDAGFCVSIRLTKPVIAAINGAVAGAGLAVACYADIRFAAEGGEIHDRPRGSEPAGRVWSVLAAPAPYGRHARRMIFSSRAASSWQRKPLHSGWSIKSCRSTNSCPTHTTTSAL